MKSLNFIKFSAACRDTSRLEGRLQDVPIEEDIVRTLQICCNLVKKERKNRKAAYAAREKALECASWQDLTCLEAVKLFEKAFKESENKKEEYITNDGLFYTLI